MAKDCTTGKPLPECLSEFEHIKDKLDMLIKYLKGNGSEDNCVMVRLTKIEDAVGRRQWFERVVLTALVGTAFSVFVGGVVAVIHFMRGVQ